ncbi:MAG: TlpA family protein disulfide reductase [Sandaracinaceae bacterium]
MVEPRPSPSPLRRALRRVGPWALLAGAVGLWMMQGPGGHTLSEGTPAPAMLAPWTGPGDLDLGEQRGHVTVLAFWATWCPACRQEGPVLSRVHARIGPHGDRVVGVSVDRAALSAVASTARSLGMTYPIALTDTATAERFGVELLPTVYVIDGNGDVASSFTGTVSERTLVAAVESARARPGSPSRPVSQR